MWKKYVILALGIVQSLNAQQYEFPTNSRTSGDQYSQYYDYNSFNSPRILDSPQLPSQRYNTNSRNSFGNQHALTENTPAASGQTANTNQQSSIPESSSQQQPFSPTVGKFPCENSFNSQLFNIMSSINKNKNMVYSPISLQTLLAFIFTISEGKLFEELSQIMVISTDRLAVAKMFENILQTANLTTPPTTLIMANKLYYDQRFGSIDYSVRNFAEKSFASEIEPINFSTTDRAANIINTWVSERTRHLIQDIVTPSSITGNTKALLLNSLYFKSEWLTKFDMYDTKTQDFFMSRHSRVPVNMMYNEDIFRYGNFQKDLQAAVVELPYKATNLSMMLILPTEIEGLAELERKLSCYDLEVISQKLKREMVTVKLPKFKIGYEIDMIRPLQKMGLNALFNNDDGSINLFRYQQQNPLQIDQFKHKSLIDVNEAGTEATATTLAKYIPLSIPSDMKYFVADHPFVFVIRNSYTTFFVGHVVQF